MRLALLFCSILVHFSASAQETQPGDSCTGAETGRYILAGGPEASNVGYLIICDGTTWNKVLSFGANGTMAPQFVNTSSCVNGQALTFDLATGGIRCGPSDSIAPTWVTPAGTIATTTVNLAVNQAVSASDESGTPTYSKVSGDPWLSVNTTGTVSGIAPASAGTYSISIRATDGAGNIADRTFNVVVGGATGPSGCSNPGEVCSDGTIYIGITPDGDVDYFMTQVISIGQFSWNSGTNGNYIDTPLVNCDGVQSTCVTGESNTNQLVLIDSSTAAGFQTHNAALACFCLGESHVDAPDGVVPSECSGDPVGTNSIQGHGYDDWYLPALAEIDILYKNLDSPGDLNNPNWPGGYSGNPGHGNGGGTTGGGSIVTSNIYWSSSEINVSLGRNFLFSSGNAQASGNCLSGSCKNISRDVVCVRK